MSKNLDTTLTFNNEVIVNDTSSEEIKSHSQELSDFVRALVSRGFPHINRWTRTEMQKCLASHNYNIENAVEYVLNAPLPPEWVPAKSNRKNMEKDVGKWNQKKVNNNNQGPQRKENNRWKINDNDQNQPNRNQNRNEKGKFKKRDSQGNDNKTAYQKKQYSKKSSGVSQEKEEQKREIVKDVKEVKEGIKKKPSGKWKKKDSTETIKQDETEENVETEKQNQASGTGAIEANEEVVLPASLSKYPLIVEPLFGDIDDGIMSPMPPVMYPPPFDPYGQMYYSMAPQYAPPMYPPQYVPYRYEEHYYPPQNFN
eukprot:TRINITY_DN425_c0_g1_i1.p1 TRINITY_DN425_c0_g1~~TRINITY_DN425_c0_g1_i1.p1  ORF type:complete len:349 (+),score=100.29 TRINITY_DN425_c0_g1_i1:112-1047(+)